jgi:malate synthase
MQQRQTSQVLGNAGDAGARILTAEALAFVADLQLEFGPTRLKLLAARAERQERIDAGELPDFLAETRSVRDDPDWRVAAAPQDLLDRRVEITGPVDRKMVINALNSGARMFMADFEDSNAPTWRNCVEGQANLIDAVDRTISLDTEAKQYRLQDEIATLLVRPRGWHLHESHLLIDGDPASASLFDFGLYIFHCGSVNWTRDRARTSTCPSSSLTSKRGCGTTSLSSRRSNWGFRAGRSVPPSSSRRFWLRSRWTRSSTS